MERRVPMMQCQRRLALVWYLLSAPAFILLILQTLSGVWASKETQLWGWALPTMMPTLLLVTGIVVVDAVQAMNQGKLARTVPVFARDVTIGLSTFYLILVNVVIVFTRRTGYSLDALQRSSAFLGPVQGLVGLALAVFFGTAKEDK